jgi:ATP-binding cassette subfamily B protein
MARIADALCWLPSQLPEAIETLAERSGLGVVGPSISSARSAPIAADAAAFDRWMAVAARRRGLEAEPIGSLRASITSLVLNAAPAIIRLNEVEDVRFLVVLRRRGRDVQVIAPDGRTGVVPAVDVETGLCRDADTSLATETERILAALHVADRRRPRARDALIRERTEPVWIDAGWMFRPLPDADTITLARHAGFTRAAVCLVAAHAAQYLLWILSAWMIGRAALDGHIERDWLIAWTLVLLTLLPFQLWATRLKGRVAIVAGSLLKSRLLASALGLDLDRARAQGAGQLLGRVLGADAAESLALNGGTATMLAIVELTMAAAILGLASTTLTLALVGWLLVAGLLAWRYYRRRLDWTDLRLAMTDDLVQKMVGHRTRVAQQPSNDWHAGEDRAVDRYRLQSERADRLEAMLTAVVPGGWLVAGLLAIAPTFLSSTVSIAGLAVEVGGILLAHRAFRRLVEGLPNLVGALVAWRQAAPMAQAVSADACAAHGPVDLASPRRVVGVGETILEAEGLSFRRHVDGAAAVDGCRLRIVGGDTVWLRGASGGGKSTLISLLTGLRAPQKGVLFLKGLDGATLGPETWRRHVALVPQSHENHVLTGTLAFNLLMGRAWPPTSDDLTRAEAVCRELGLGALLDRMPAGLHQAVGESGWQLSHGERSRVFMARALLQDADLIVVDESLAPLDPHTATRAVDTLVRRAPALLVVAHS